MNSFSLRSLLKLSFLALFSVSVFWFEAAAESRTWTSIEGGKIEAVPLGKTEKEVRIRRHDGEVFLIPFERLSEEDRNWISEWEPEELPALSAEEAVVLIRSGRSAGTGFLANLGGQVYVVTNQHVIDGALPEEIEITDLKGKRLKVGRLEVSPTLDLARILVAADFGMDIRYPISLDAEITAYGNSRGGGVATVNHGKVVGIAEEVVEVSAEIVQGNSGGPIVDSEGFAIGVAAYVTRGEVDRADWVSEGTRYEEARRFGIRLSERLQWEPVEWSAYASETRRMREAEAVLEQAVLVAGMIIADPVSPLILRGASYPDSIRDVVRRHNQHVRKFESKLGEEVTSRAAVRRANQAQNANFRARLRGISELLEAEDKSLRAGRPLPSTPYLRERLDTFAEMIERIDADLGKVMQVDRTFYYLRRSQDVEQSDRIGR